MLRRLILAAALAAIPAADAHAASLNWTECGDGLAVRHRPRAARLRPAPPAGRSAGRHPPARDRPAAPDRFAFVNNGGPGNSGSTSSAATPPKSQPRRAGSLRHRRLRPARVGAEHTGAASATPTPRRPVCRSVPSEVRAFTRGLKPTSAAAAAPARCPARAPLYGQRGPRHGSAARGGRRRKLTFAGYSYGTLLGLTYANLFPAAVRALVLDGNPSTRSAWMSRIPPCRSHCASGASRRRRTRCCFSSRSCKRAGDSLRVLGRRPGRRVRPRDARLKRGAPSSSTSATARCRSRTPRSSTSCATCSGSRPAWASTAGDLALPARHVIDGEANPEGEGAGRAGARAGLRQRLRGQARHRVLGVRRDPRLAAAVAARSPASPTPPGSGPRRVVGVDQRAVLDVAGSRPRPLRRPVQTKGHVGAADAGQRPLRRRGLIQAARVRFWRTRSPEHGCSPSRAPATRKRRSTVPAPTPRSSAI